MSHEKKPNWKEAKRYLALLTGEADPLTCLQVFADAPAPATGANTPRAPQ